MPSLHIPEPAFQALADHYGYEEAKSRVKAVVREHAREVNTDD